MECIRQTISGSNDFGGEGSATISRNGDLIGQMYLSYSLNNTVNLVSHFGNAMIKNAEIEIGGQLVDRQDGRWMQIHTDLTEPNPSGNPCGPCPHQKLAGIGVNFATTGDSTTTKNDMVYWVPFKFWFCRNPGLFLPLIALQYHEVKLKIELWDQGSVTSSGDTAAFSRKPELWVDYVYLDTNERRRFAQVSHEYLIEQVQMKKSNWSTDVTSIKLNFNHPVKELVWTFSKSGEDGIKDNFFPGTALHHNSILDGSIAKGATGTAQPIDLAQTLVDGEAIIGSTTAYIKQRTFQLKLNGHDRFYQRNSHYFTLSQIWKHHTGYGSPYPVSSVYVYSFALKPEEHQPSGTCNFSRIDSAILHYEVVWNKNSTTGYDKQTNNIRVYAINYNVLRIMSGMGGLAYSN
jgi:hypothetical protein